jgi:hypothetical protein
MNKIESTFLSIDKALSSEDNPKGYEELYQTLTDYYCDISEYNEQNS